MRSIYTDGLAEIQRQITLVRHAKSSWDDESVSDHDRPLNERGKAAAPKMGAALAEILPKAPDLVLVSSAARTQETWSFVKPALEAKFGEASTDYVLEELYLAPPAKLIEILKTCDQAAYQVLVFGHNPGLQELSLAVTSHGPVTAWRDMAASFPTCAAASFKFNGDWADININQLRFQRFDTPQTLGFR